MLNVNFLKWLLLAMLLVVTLPVFAASSIDKVIVFGDSLSDNGNFYAATYKFFPKVPPYYKGRFSNGPTWAERLVEKIHLQNGLANFAYGAATAQANRNDIAWQVNDYLKKSADDHQKGRHLYVVWIGSNDYLNGKGVSESVGHTIDAIKVNLDILIKQGAKKILVFGLADIGRTPLAHVVGKAYAEKMSGLVHRHNIALLRMLSKERKAHPSVRFVYFDMAKYFKDAIDHPKKFGLKNTTDACFKDDAYMFSVLRNPKYAQKDMPITNSNAIVYCADADAYLFWDHAHPTRVVHERIAEAVVVKLKKNGLLKS